MTASLRRMRLISLPLLVLVISFAWATPAFAAEAVCTAAGGEWSGNNADNGTCTYPAGNSTAVSSCDSSIKSYQVTYVADVETDSNCILSRPATRVGTNGGSVTDITLPIKGKWKGYVEFFGGTCKQNCTVDSVLPALAKQSLLVTPLASVYVRIDGGVGAGSYQVCFANPLNESLNLYRFIGGTWWPVNRSIRNPICTLASGDGAFYLH
jgi:hypothetical protein